MSTTLRVPVVAAPVTGSVTTSDPAEWRDGVGAFGRRPRAVGDEDQLAAFGDGHPERRHADRHLLTLFRVWPRL